RSDRGVDLTAADIQAIFPAAVDDRFAGAVVAGRRVAAAVMHLQASTAASAGDDPLEQRRAFPHGTTAVMWPRAGVLCEALLIGFKRLQVDEALVVIRDEDRPVGARAGFDAFAYAANLIDVRHLLRSAIDVYASIEGVGEDLMDLRVSGRDPADILKRVRLQREAQALRAEPQPYPPRRAHFGKAVEDGAQRSGDRFVRMQQDLAVTLTSHEADRQAPTQLTTLCLVADAAEQPRPQDVQFCLRHRALQAQHQAVVEQPRVVNPVGIADERVGDTAEVQEAVPVGVVARQTGDLEAEYDPDLTERHIRGHAREAGPLAEAGTGDAEIFIDDLGLFAGPSQVDRALGQVVLPRSRLPIVLDLGAAGLAHVDNRAPAQMVGGDLGVVTHGRAPARRASSRSAGRASRSPWPAAPHRVRSTRARHRRGRADRESSAAAWLGSCGVGRCRASAAETRRRRASTTIRAWSNCVQQASNAG